MRGLSVSFLIVAALAAALLRPTNAAAERNWTGPYAGANAGIGLSNGKVEDPDCFLCSSDSFAEKLFQFGVHGGYNKQLSSVVLGGEAQADYGTQHHTGIIGQPTPPSLHDYSSLTWTLSALARAGLAYQDTMFYVGAGPALSHISGSASTGSNFHYAQAYWQPGFKGIVGAEFFVAQRVSVRAQYSLLYVSNRVAWQDPNTTGAAQMSRLNWVNQQSVVTLGLDWHF